MSEADMPNPFKHEFTGNSGGVRIIAIAISVLLIVLSAVTLTMTYWRRGLFPLKGRGLRLSIPVGILLTLQQVNLILLNIYGDSFDVDVQAWITALTVCVAAALYSLRAFHILISFHIAARAGRLHAIVQRQRDLADQQARAAGATSQHSTQKDSLAQSNRLSVPVVDSRSASTHGAHHQHSASQLTNYLSSSALVVSIDDADLATEVAGPTQEPEILGMIALDEREWFQRARRLHSLNVLLGIFGGYVVVLLVTMVSFTLADHQVHTSQVWSVVTYTLNFFAIVPAIVCACLMRKFSEDGFMLRWELRWSGWSFLVLGVVFTVVRILPSSDRAKLHIMFTHSMMLIHFIIVFLCPLVKSFAVQRYLRKKGPFTLEQLIQFREGVDLFRTFLDKEFSGPNLELYLDVVNLKQGVATQRLSDVEAQDAAMRIYSTFVDEKAALQINLSHAVRKGIQDQITSQDWSKVAPESIFDAAQKQVYNLMAHDSFLRLRKTPAFQDFYNNVVSVSRARGNSHAPGSRKSRPRGWTGASHNSRPRGRTHSFNSTSDFAHTPSFGGGRKLEGDATATA